MGFFKKDAVAVVEAEPQNVFSKASIEELLSELQKYGQPRLGMYGDTWCCSVEMHVASVGSKFDISSGHKSTTPMAATVLCYERVLETVAKFGK